MFSRRSAINTGFCQSWKDLTAEEVAEFSAEKPRAACHLNKGHVGDHEDKILALAWSSSGWPRNRVYPSKLRAQPAPVSAADMRKLKQLLEDDQPNG